MKYVEQVERFKKTLTSTYEQLLDALVNVNEEDDELERFDMRICVGEQILTVQLNADSFTRMLGFLDDEIKEEKEKEMQELNKQNKQAMVDALLVFRKGYMKVLDAWENYNIDEKLLKVPRYPFDKSFDELGLVEWCDDVLGELKKVR